MKCKNCNTALITNKGYCHVCGARIIKNRLSIKNLLTQLSEEFLNYDNKLLKTLKHLITKPEVVIGSYVQGVRKKYVNPVSFFTISLTLSGILGFLISNYFSTYLDLSSISSVYDESNKELQTEIFNFTNNYSSLLTSLAVPPVSILSFVVFFNKKYNLTEHVIISLYTYSEVAIFSFFISLIVLLCAPSLYLNLSFLIIGLILMYYAYTLIRVFKLSFTQFILKSLLFLAIVLFLMIAITVIITILVINGVVDLSQFATQQP